MIRSLRAKVVLALVVFIVVVTAADWISSRTSPSGQLLTPSLQRLNQQPGGYEGKRVRVTGTVRVFEAGKPDEYYVLEEAGQYRVAIHGLPLATLRPLTNTQMTVQGDFHYKDGVGVYIDVTAWSIPPATPAA